MHLSELNICPRCHPDEIHHTSTADGWRLGLARYRPRGAAPHGEPVLLQHGLGTSGKQFDLGVGTDEAPVPSLARWLSAQGYDVWVPDLRGSGRSVRPRRGFPKRWNWSVDDFVGRDIPAILDHVLAHSDHERVHWVGHSLGGILLLCHCALHGSDQVASGVAAAAGFDYSGAGSRYLLIEPLKGLGRAVRWVPAGLLGKLASPLFGRWENPLEASFFHHDNIAPAAARAIAVSQHDVSGEVLYQLASLFKAGGLRSLDGSTCYADLAANIQTPILLLAGEKDTQCAPAIADRTRQLLRGECEVIKLGRSFGQEQDYGHFDLFAGLNAEREVYPAVGNWLASHAMS